MFSVFCSATKTSLVNPAWLYGFIIKINYNRKKGRKVHDYLIFFCNSEKKENSSRSRVSVQPSASAAREMGNGGDGRGRGRRGGWEREATIILLQQYSTTTEL